MLSLRTADGLSNEKWMSLSPLDMSLYDAFKDSKDVQDLIQSGFLLLSEKGIKATYKGLSVLDSIVPILLLHLEQRARTSLKSQAD
ncbi:radical S-adenosyl methionine domain-containing protein 1, mitochondrial-like [Orbicella faveolata]|uniref:radical S-adenosyl methionine domain-containing protein 1, mitochondrial-like n=1 Tax=Orbicella faveolata TaxID=48498 RepID=UPI0009E1A81C|nr:radical S-adenosyl methionine domain-containing protein 1, mitochondrial-like [Orbicella faveolata]